MKICKIFMDLGKIFMQILTNYMLLNVVAGAVMHDYICLLSTVSVKHALFISIERLKHRERTLCITRGEST